jgi:AcrR family transcriptional regulator
VRQGSGSSRGSETVAVVLEVTRSLLEEQGEQGVRIEEVQRRSGVSSGSIYHHFGDRAGLIAAAQVDRFDRAVREDAVGLVATLTGAATQGDPAVYFAALRRQAATVVQPERSRIRWARITALSSAWRRPDLLASLGAAFTELVDALVDGVRQLQDLGALDPALDPRAAAIYSQIHSLGLLFNDVDPRAVSDEEWVGLMVHLAVTFSPVRPDLRSDGSDRSARRSPQGSGLREQARQQVAGFTLPRRRGPAEHRSRDDVRFDAVVELAAASMQDEGSTAVRVEDIRRRVGVSSGWFHRRFGDRDGLLDVTRLVLFTRAVTADLDVLDALVSQSLTPLQFAEGIRSALEFAGSNEVLAARRWQRLDVLAASVGSPALRVELGHAVGESTDRMERIVRQAQGKGLLLPDLPPRAVAHFLGSAPLGFQFIGLDGNRVTDELWVDLLIRAVGCLQPSAA